MSERPADRPMRFLGVGKTCDLGSLYHRLIGEGHEVRAAVTEVRGLSGTVVYRGTDTPATLEYYSGVPMSQPITVTEDSIGPWFDVVGDIPAIYYLDWKSGEWIIPLNSPEGLAEFASESDGYTATRHQREVGTGYFDQVASALNPKGSTLALAGSTETQQFH